MRRKVTIEDIARESGASMTTVSMVLRDKPGIGAETRQRVLDAARDLGYRRRASTSDQQAVRTAAMVLRARTPRDAQLPSVNPFYSDVIGGIEQTARTRRINLLYATLPVDQENIPYEMPEHLLGQELDGVLLIGAFSADTVATIAAGRSAPIVLVDAPARPSRHDAVVSDNVGGASLAVEHLIDLGHRRIALVGPDLDADPNFAQRRDGYLQALARHDLPSCLVTSSRSGMTAVGDAAAEALADHPELTALVGANDTSAIEAMRAAQQAGRAVPADISVIGFDDIARAGEISPRLTTMAVDRITMGRQAIRLLEDRLAWPDACRLMTVLQPTLLVRESTGPPPGVTGSDEAGVDAG